MSRHDRIARALEHIEHKDVVAALGAQYISLGWEHQFEYKLPRKRDGTYLRIDLAVARDMNWKPTYYLEVEMYKTVTDAEAGKQWRDYDTNLRAPWNLVVPASLKARAEQLCRSYGFVNCTVGTW